MAMRFSYDRAQGGWVYDMHGKSPSIQNAAVRHGIAVFPGQLQGRGLPFEVSGVDGMGTPGRQTASRVWTERDVAGLPYMRSEWMMGKPFDGPKLWTPKVWGATPIMQRAFVPAPPCYMGPRCV